MALYLSATIRHHRQIAVIQHSIHTPPICLIKVCGGGRVQNHKRVQQGVRQGTDHQYKHECGLVYVFCLEKETQTW